MRQECPVWVAAQRQAQSPALLFQGRQWSWGEVHRHVNGAAHSLSQLGVCAGDAVAVRTWNRPEVIWLFWGAARLGASVVPFNARLTEAEVQPLLTRVEPKCTWGELPGALALSRLEAGGDEPGFIDDENTAVSLFTSGTTGIPKLVSLTHGNFLAAAQANAARLGGESAQRWLGTLPLFHIGGLAMLYRCAVYGASLVLESQFDVEAVCRHLDEGVTHLSLVPTMLERVLKHRGERHFSGVQAALIGGGPASPRALQRARALGLPVLQTYGLTEACSQVTTEIPLEADGASAGRPLAGIEVRVVRPDSSGVGEIQVRGPTVSPALLAAGNGWLATGDLGVIEDGRLRVLARRDDLIISGGENIYPAEVEAVLSQYPGVHEVAVTAREDEEWGQIPVALAVLEPSVNADALAVWAKERLAHFKVPKVWVRVGSLAKTASGKIDRASLRGVDWRS